MTNRDPRGITGATSALLTVSEAAEMLGTSKSTLYRSIQEGISPVPIVVIRRRPFIARRSVERLLEGGEPLEVNSEG